MVKGAIVVANGVLKGREFVIDGLLKIGRHPDNHVQLLNQGTSRFHAEVEEREGGYWLRDLQSKGGTYVAGRLVTEKRLDANDEIVVGDVTMCFRLLDENGAVKKRSRTTVSFDLRNEEVGSMAEVAVEREGEHSTDELGALTKLYNMLYQANLLISSAAPPAEIYDDILKQLFTMVSADRGIIMVFDPASGELVPIAAETRDPNETDSHVRVSRTIVNKAMEQRIALLTSDAMRDEKFASGASIFAQKIRSVICAPLLYKEEVLGVIYLDTKKATVAFDQEVVRLVTAIASSAALAIKNTTYVEELKAKSKEIQQSYLHTINVIANAIEARDKYTLGHAWRVTRFGLAIAERLGWAAPQRRSLEMGGVLHDVGKVGIRDAILCKEARLSDDEYKLMKLHPEIGARILQDVPFLSPAIPYARFHHERWDGRGYPQKLQGDEIPLEGRLLALADAFDAMNSNRVYRKALSKEDAIAEILRCSGSQFDPELAQVFVELVRAGEVDYILQNKTEEDSSKVVCPVCTTPQVLPETKQAGDQLDCLICRKKLRLLKRDGQLVAETIGRTNFPD